MNLVQFSHGVLVEAENFFNRMSEALPSFNPEPHELPANPFAAEAAETAAPVAEVAPVVMPAPVDVQPLPSAPVTAPAKPTADPFSTPVTKG